MTSALFNPFGTDTLGDDVFYPDDGQHAPDAHRDPFYIVEEDQSSRVRMFGEHYIKPGPPDPHAFMWIGRRGQGKDTAMTSWLGGMMKVWQRLNVPMRAITNYYINFLRRTPPSPEYPHGQPIDIYHPYILDYIEEFPDWLRNATLQLTEIQTAASNRRAMNKSNFFLSQFLVQMRHRNVEASFTTQFPQTIDPQTLYQVDVFIEVEKVGFRWKKLDGQWQYVPDVLMLHIHDYWGQWTGKNYRKFWPPQRWQADRRVTLRGVSAFIGTFSTNQIIVPRYMDAKLRSRIIDREEDNIGSDRAWAEAMRPQIEEAAQERGMEIVKAPSTMGELVDAMPEGVFNVSLVLGTARGILQRPIGALELAGILEKNGFDINQVKGTWWAQRK